jgi:hypothetical protein
MSSRPSARDALVAALRSHAGAPCEFLLVTNSIRIRFDISECPKGKAYLWIDPPWRLRAGTPSSLGARAARMEARPAMKSIAPDG